TFFLMGIPALLVGALVKLTVREPRTLTQGAQRANAHAPRMAEVLRVLWNQRSMRHLGIAIILFWTLGLGLGPWYAAFMMRSHGMGTAELGIYLGLIFGLGGMLGTWAGGYVGARWFVGNERGLMRLSAATVAALVPCYACFLLVSSRCYAIMALV